MRDLAFDISANDRTAQIFDQIKAKGDSTFRNVDAAVSRLNMRFDDGYAKEMRFAQGLDTIDRALQQNKIHMSDAERLIAGMSQKLGASVDPARLAAAGQDRLAHAVRGANAAIDQQQRELVEAEAAARRMNASPGRSAAANDNEAVFRRRGLMYQGFDIGTSLAGGINPAMVAIQQGPQILQMYAGQGGVNAALKDTAGLLGTVARGFWPIGLAAGAASLAVLGMQDDIEKATGKSVSFGEVTSAVLKTVADDIQRLVQPAIDAMWPPIEYAFGKLTSAAVDWAELIVNSFRAVGSDIAFIWQQLPNIVGAAVVGSMNAMVTGVMAGIEKASDYVDSWIDLVNRALATINQITGGDLQVPKIGYDAGDFTIPNSYYDDLSKANAEHRRRVQEILGDSPLRDYYDSVKDRAQDQIMSDRAGKMDPWANMRDVDQGALRAMREQMKAQQEMMREADRATNENRSTFRGFLDDIDEAISKGENFWDVMKSGAMSFLDKMKDRAFDNLAEFLFPTSKSGGGNAGPWGIVGQMLGFGGKAAGAAASPVAQAVANDNFRAPIEAVTRAPLGPVTLASGIRQSAGALGISPRDLAAAISYETAGTFDPLKRGPTTQWGQHRGLIQFGEPQAKQFGVDWSNPIGSQLGSDGAVVKYLRDAGVKPGMGMMDVYSAINAGGVGRYGASDAGNGGAWGTVADKVNSQMGGHYANADRLLAASAEKASRALDGITTNATTTADGLGGFGKSLTGAATSLATAFDPKNLFGLGLSNTGSGFMDGRGGGFGGMLGYATPAAAGGGGGLFGSLLGGLGGLAGGFLSFIPKLFGFADGTDFAPGGMSIVGERGPELVNLARGSQVMTAERSARLMGSMNDNRSSEVLLRVVGEEGPMFRPTIQAEAKGVAVRVVGDGISSYDKGMPSRVGDIMERNG